MKHFKINLVDLVQLPNIFSINLFEVFLTHFRDRTLLVGPGKILTTYLKTNFVSDIFYVDGQGLKLSNNIKPATSSDQQSRNQFLMSINIIISILTIFRKKVKNVYEQREIILDLVVAEQR